MSGWQTVGGSGSRKGKGSRGGSAARTPKKKMPSVQDTAGKPSLGGARNVFTLGMGSTWREGDEDLHEQESESVAVLRQRVVQARGGTHRVMGTNIPSEGDLMAIRKAEKARLQGTHSLEVDSEVLMMASGGDGLGGVQQRSKQQQKKLKQAQKIKERKKNKGGSSLQVVPIFSFAPGTPVNPKCSIPPTSVKEAMSRVDPSVLQVQIDYFRDLYPTNFREQVKSVGLWLEKQMEGLEIEDPAKLLQQEFPLNHAPESWVSILQSYLGAGSKSGASLQGYFSWVVELLCTGGGMSYDLPKLTGCGLGFRLMTQLAILQRPTAFVEAAPDIKKLVAAQYAGKVSDHFLLNLLWMCRQLLRTRTRCSLHAIPSLLIPLQQGNQSNMVVSLIGGYAEEASRKLRQEEIMSVETCSSRDLVATCKYFQDNSAVLRSILDAVVLMKRSSPRIFFVGLAKLLSDSRSSKGLVEETSRICAGSLSVDRACYDLLLQSQDSTLVVSIVEKLYQYLFDFEGKVTENSVADLVQFLVKLTANSKNGSLKHPVMRDASAEMQRRLREVATKLIPALEKIDVAAGSPSSAGPSGQATSSSTSSSSSSSKGTPNSSSAGGRGKKIFRGIVRLLLSVGAVVAGFYVAYRVVKLDSLTPPGN